MKKMLTTAVCTCALAVSAVAAWGTTSVYDNLGSNNSFIPLAATFGLVPGGDGEQGLQFTASQTIRLTEIDVAIGAVLSGNGIGPASVQLRLDAGNTPGAVIETWTTPTIQSYDGTIQSLTSVLGPTVAAGSKYWVTVSRAAGSLLGGGWFMASVNQPGGVLAASHYVGNPWTESTLVRGYGTRVSGMGELLGDANENGRIDADDYSLIDRGFARHLSGWRNGDFNGDNQVTSADYLILDTALGQQGGLSPDLLEERQAEFGTDYVNQLVAAVPEPGSAMVVVAGGLLAIGRRRAR